jgi:hypothetical protein
VRPADAPPDAVPGSFRRGQAYPRAIAWLGFSAFWGHMWHLAASFVATEDIDARDWMDCLSADELTGRTADVLGAAASEDSGEDGESGEETADGGGAPLTDRLERDLWIDYVADTGDDADVSAAVAEMIFREYRLPHDDDEIVAPRGDMLFFGGDTAYPVATEWEMHNRVGVPFNRALRKNRDGKSRALFGIPGNHDWYDGLDGFARMFRARRGTVVDRAEMVQDDTIDTGGQIGHLIDWVEAFRVGHYVAKRPTLPLLGYTPVQSASYWCLRLAPNLDVWGIDRQLRTVDYGQRSYFMKERAAAPDRALMLLISDPAYAMLEPYHIGQRILQSLEITFEDDEPLVLTGDTHHYCRQRFGRAMHVIAGGGGAFLHPARIAREGFEPPAAEFPGPKASASLALGVPFAIAAGRAGYVVHAVAMLIYLPLLGVLASGGNPMLACLLIGGGTTVACGMLGGWRKRKALTIGTLAAITAAAIAFTPWGMMLLIQHFAAGFSMGVGWQAILAVGLSIIPAAFYFGAFLMTLTLTGLEQHQAFSALAHPGYKHFVRLRVRRDGSAVDGWVLGKVDTLDPDAEMVLVDRWTWNNPSHGDAIQSDNRGADSGET